MSAAQRQAQLRAEAAEDQARLARVAAGGRLAAATILDAMRQVRDAAARGEIAPEHVADAWVGAFAATLAAMTSDLGADLAEEVYLGLRPAFDEARAMLAAHKTGAH